MEDLEEKFLVNIRESWKRAFLSQPDIREDKAEWYRCQQTMNDCQKIINSVKERSE